MNVKCKRKTNAWLQFVFFPRSSKEEREEKGSESERKRADRTSLKGKQRLVRTIEINRSGNWREDTHTHTHTHTHTARKEGECNIQPLFPLHVGVRTTDTHTQTHIRQAAITHQHPTKKKKKKKKKEREREREGERRLAVISTKTNNKHSLVCRVTSRRSAARYRFAKTHKRVYLNSINAAIFASMMTPVSALGVLYCAVMCLTGWDEDCTDAATCHLFHLHTITAVWVFFWCDILLGWLWADTRTTRSRPEALLKTDGERRYVRLNLRPLPLAASAMCAPVRDGVLVTQGGWVPFCQACSVFNYPSTPFRKKEREKETGPVQIDYSNHLEDSENERRGGRRKWDTTTSRGHSLCDTPTVQYDHCLRDAW